jgi:hypothetical protein
MAEVKPSFPEGSPEFNQKIGVLDKKMDSSFQRLNRESSERGETVQMISLTAAEFGKSIQENEKRKIQLVNKCEEYKGRLAESSGSTIPPTSENGLDAWYKREVLRQLLSNRTISVDDVRNAIIENTGSINDALFRRACKVVNSYIIDGGKSLKGGTGLH